MGKQTITNKFNLPQTLVDACQTDTHRVAGDISVTQLIDGPQVRILKRLHDYETDVSENLYMLMGTALHHILERANISEERKRAFILTAETIIAKAESIKGTHADKAQQLINAGNFIFALIPSFFGTEENRYIFERTLQLDFGTMTLYGTFDLYDKVTGILYDYKFCSVYNWVFPEARIKWERQTNIYAYMLIQNGYKVNGIRVVAFFRDWSEHGFIRDSKNYPDAQVKELNIQMYPGEQVHKYILNRIKIHSDAEHGQITLCNGEERWAKSDQHAVKTGKSKKALRVFDDKAQALSFIQENRHKYSDLFIEFRPGESVRCERYCQVSKFCPQYKVEQEHRQNQLNSKQT